MIIYIQLIKPTHWTEEGKCTDSILMFAFDTLLLMSDQADQNNY